MNAQRVIAVIGAAASRVFTNREVAASQFMRDAAADEDGECIFCGCRPDVSYCGRYVEGPLTHVIDVDDDGVCAGCLTVEDATGCPNCGCRPDNLCKLCYVNLVRGD